MARQRRAPSLQALAVFEAVGRHLSFSAAAEQLGTTQPAVSQRISALEAEIGTPLFRRLHRGVVLTPEGERLHRAVRDSLAIIREAVAGLESVDEKTLTVATDFMSLPLLHLESARPGLWLTWYDLVPEEDRTRTERQPDLTLNNYHLVV